jgi:hypothetical protein
MEAESASLGHGARTNPVSVAPPNAVRSDLASSGPSVGPKGEKLYDTHDDVVRQQVAGAKPSRDSQRLEPSSHENTGKAIQPVALVPVGAPTAALHPALPRLGDGSARGETQPGIPPPGDHQRFVEREEKLQPPEPDVDFNGGQLRVGKVLINMQHVVEAKAMGDNRVRIVTVAGEHEFGGVDGKEVRRQLGLDKAERQATP